MPPSGTETQNQRKPQPTRLFKRFFLSLCFVFVFTKQSLYIVNLHTVDYQGAYQGACDLIDLLGNYTNS